MKNNPIVYDLPRQISVAKFRTLTGHDNIRKHFHRVGSVDLPIRLIDANMSDDHLNYCLGLIDVVAVSVTNNFNRFVCNTKLYWATHHRLMVDVPRSGEG